MSALEVAKLSGHWGGRHSDDYDGKIDVRRVRVGRDGYGPDGTYWGAGAPLWNVTDHETEGSHVDFYVMAYDKESAKAKIAAAYPGAVARKRRR